MVGADLIRGFFLGERAEGGYVTCTGQNYTFFDALRVNQEINYLCMHRECLA